MNIQLLIEGIMLCGAGREKLNKRQRYFVASHYAMIEGIDSNKAEKMIIKFFKQSHINPSDWSKTDLVQVIKISLIKDFNIYAYYEKSEIIGDYIRRRNDLNIEYLRRAIKYCRDQVFCHAKDYRYDQLWLSNQVYRQMTLYVYQNYVLFNQPESSLSVNEDRSRQFKYITNYIEQYFTHYGDISARAMLFLLDLHLDDDRKYKANLDYQKLLDAVKSKVVTIEHLNDPMPNDSLDQIIHDYLERINYDIHFNQSNYVDSAYVPVQNAIATFLCNLDLKQEITYEAVLKLIYNRIDHTGIFAPKPKQPNMLQKLVRIFK